MIRNKINDKKVNKTTQKQKKKRLFDISKIVVKTDSRLTSIIHFRVLSDNGFH